jgi:Leucine-rich repeat (LRR) protein
VKLQESKMKNEELLLIEKARVEKWNTLDLSNTQLTSLDVTGLASLKTLYLSNTQLTSLDVTGLASLETLDLNNTQLTSLDVTGLVSLETLDLNNTQLTSLDVTGLVSLNTLCLNNTQLTSLDESFLNLEGVQIGGFSGANLKGFTHPFKVPVIPNIHKAVWNAVKDGNFDMDSWHSYCGTMHCRAGWVVVLAGEAGKALEAKIGTSAAAALIYLESGVPKIPDFHASNEDALADIKRLAGE